MEEQIKRSIRIIDDFPVKGISFKDITPLLKESAIYKDTIDAITNMIEGKEIDYIACIDARGFLIAPAVAYKLGVGLIPIRKHGKLPYECYESRYFLEYGENALCMHKDAVKPLSRVVIIDDVLATGGTLKASIDLVRQCGGIVEACICLIELEELNGKDAIDVPVFSLVKY